jgi:hypothetical protein
MAEMARRMDDDISVSLKNDEEGIKCLEKAIAASFFRKASIKRVLIRVCTGLACDYLQFNDLANSIRISEKICKYGSSLTWLGLVVKPTLSGGALRSEPLAPCIAELADYYIEKYVTENEAINISTKLRALITKADLVLAGM